MYINTIQNLINCQSSYISYISIHLENVDLKTGFLRIFFLDIYRSQTDYINVDFMYLA